VAYRRLLTELPEGHFLAVFLVSSGILEEKEDAPFDNWSATRHGIKDGLKIGKVASVAHQVQVPADLLEEALLFATHTVPGTRESFLVAVPDTWLTPIVDELAEVQVSQAHVSHTSSEAV